MVEALHIEGDLVGVDGRVEAEGDVCVQGSVGAGGFIKTKGSVEVDGDVADGATLSAHGSVYIGGGVQGEKTRVVSMADLQCHFVRNASVMAVGDIRVGYHLSNAQARAGGKVVVGGADEDRGGRIVGGEVTSTLGIEASTLGASGSRRTLVGCQPSVETAVRLAKLRKGLEHCEGEIRRIARTLDAQSLEPGQLQTLLRRTPPSKREFFEDMISRLKTVVAARSEQQGKLERLEAEAARSFGGSLIEISRQVFAGVEIRFGETEALVDEDQDAVFFYWTPRGIECEAIQR